MPTYKYTLAVMEDEGLTSGTLYSQKEVSEGDIVTISAKNENGSFFDVTGPIAMILEEEALSD